MFFDDYKECEKNYNYLKVFYSICLFVVYNVKVKDVVKVRDVGSKVFLLDVFEKMLFILFSCIFKVINLGGLNDFEKEFYMLK